MGQVQLLHQDSSALKAERDDLKQAHDRELESLRSQLEENFGMQLTQMKTELRCVINDQKSDVYDLQLMSLNHSKNLLRSFNAT